MEESSAGPPQLRVLVVDDEPHNSEAVRRAFKRVPNVAVQSSTSSEAGLKAMANQVFDLFLVDYSMAGTNGLQFVEGARKIAPNGVYFMLTAYPELREVVEAQRRGLLDGILGKPWSFQELDLVIKQARTMLHLRKLRGKRLRVDGQS